jgi:hypothetical protein
VNLNFRPQVNMRGRFETASNDKEPHFSALLLV